MLIADITNAEISALTRILQLLPGENAVSYASRIMSSISVLSSRLKRPNRVSSIILPSQKLYTPMCKLHKPLNGTLIHNLFNLVALESGGRLNSLVSNNEKLTEIERARVQSLRELHSLWLKPDVYQKTFFELPDRRKWKYQADECEACMLARIGADLTVLLNIRMALLSRMSSKKLRRYGPPRLMPWIERWVASLSTGMKLSSQDFEQVIAQNDADGKALKEIRKKLWHQRRESRRLYRDIQERRKKRSTTISGGDITSTAAQPTIRIFAATTDISNRTYVEDGSDSSDAEIDVIDAYAALISTPHLPSIPSAISLHRRPAAYIFPTLLTTLSIGDIQHPANPSVHPPPTNFNTVHRSRSRGHRPSSQLIPPALDTPTSRASHYDASKLISPVDSYIQPRFPVHPAYIQPTAAAQAKRYRNLLSPDPRTTFEDELPLIPDTRPKLRDSEEELRIPETPGLPKRSSKRVSPPVMIVGHELPGVATPPGRDDDWYTVSGSNVSSMRSSKSMRESTSSWISSVSATSRYSEYKVDDQDRTPLVVSKFTVEDAEREPDWYPQKSTDSGMGRAMTMLGASGADSTFSVSSKSRSRSRSRRGSGDTTATRWSDLYEHLMCDAKR